MCWEWSQHLESESDCNTWRERWAPLIKRERCNRLKQWSALPFFFFEVQRPCDFLLAAAGDRESKKEITTSRKLDSYLMSVGACAWSLHGSWGNETQWSRTGMRSSSWQHCVNARCILADDYIHSMIIVSYYNYSILYIMYYDYIDYSIIILHLSDNYVALLQIIKGLFRCWKGCCLFENRSWKGFIIARFYCCLHSLQKLVDARFYCLNSSF